MSAAKPNEPSVFRPAVEGLLVRQLGDRLDADLRRQLAAAGVDLEHLELAYPVRVLDDCLALIARRVYADRPFEEGLKELGRLQVAGFASSPIGRAVFLLARALPRERRLARLVSLWRSANNFIQVELTPDGPGAWQLAVNRVGRYPVIIAGILEGMMSTSGNGARVEVLREENDVVRYRLVFLD